MDHALELLERGARRAGRRSKTRDHLGGPDGAALRRRRSRRLARPTAVHWHPALGGYWLGPAGLRLPKMEIPDA